MPADIKQLTLGDLILHRRGSLTFRLMLAVFGIALRLFFRRIETVNANRVPEKGGVIFVLNHPNGLIDPAMVFVALPKKISFLAKSTLFRIPVISFVLRTVDALPLYRKIDAGEDLSKNVRTFEACKDLLKSGGSIALFPEGVSHNSSKLLPAKTGAARIALGTASVDPGSPVLIAPVGLFYTSKTSFRSEALLHFGEPFAVGEARLDDNGEPARDAVRELTNKIESALREVTINAESESELRTARIASEIFASASENDTLGEKLEFLRSYIEENGRYRRNDSFNSALHEFDAELASRGIEPLHLSLSQFSRGFVVKQTIVRTWWLIFFFPIAVVGTVLHYPAYQLSKLLASYFTHHGADEIVSTVKVLAAIVLMPLTWLLAAAAIFYFWRWEAAISSIPVAIISGYIALYSLEELFELRAWAKARLLFLTRRETFLRLYVERRALQKNIKALQ